jgi:hypothetical protein
VLDNETFVYNAGNKFKFNVDAVSGTLHKSTRKSKMCVRNVTDDLCIFSDTKPHLTCNDSEEIVVLQTMLAGKEKMIVEYMTRKDYDEMFDGPLPDIVVKDMLNDIRDNIKEYVKREEGYDRLMNKDKKEGYDELEWERKWMSEGLTKAIVQNVCKYLENKHIATFDFENDACAYSDTAL